MENKINLFIRKLSTALGLNNEKTAMERLELFILEQKHDTLLNRIKAIRTNSPYVPDYNKPKVHTDILILYKEHPLDEFKPISSHTRLAQKRPIEFGNDIKAWKKIVGLDHKKELKEKKLLQLQKEQHQEVFDKEVTGYIMNRFMKTN